MTKKITISAKDSPIERVKVIEMCLGIELDRNSEEWRRLYFILERYSHFDRSEATEIAEALAAYRAKETTDD